MNEINEQRINDLYEKIISSLDGCRIFGELIDMNNIKQLVVSAYLMGGFGHLKFPVREVE